MNKLNEAGDGIFEQIVKWHEDERRVTIRRTFALGEMFHKSTGAGQPKQWLRICGRCKHIYWSRRLKACPRCEFAHYGAPMVYDGFFRAFAAWIFQIFKPNKWNTGKNDAQD